jgi:hypothetical protein
MAGPVTATGGYQLVPVTRNDGETVYVRADKADAPVMATFNERGQRSSRDLKRDDVSGAPEGSGFWDTGLGQYLRASYEGLARGAKSVREATDPFQYAGQAAQAAASMLPGAGLVEGQQDFGRMGQALKEGRYRDAAIDAGYGLVNAGTEFIPAMAAMPAIRRPGANIAERAQPLPGETIAYVDPSAVDEAWRADPDFYIPPGAGTGKYEGAVEYLQGARPVEAPSLGVMPDSLGFTDGRHRFAAMRDMGLDRIPVSMDPWSLENARARGLIDDPPAKRPGIIAYHGSPHDFDRFDMSKIGTGEGAQSYGHGLYFAENEKVARGYRDTLSKSGTDGARRRLQKAGGDIDAAIASAQAKAAQYRAGGADGFASAVEEDLRFLEKFKQTGEWTPGRMYQVEIAANPSGFLDWDAPLSSQPKQVQDLFGYVPRATSEEENAVFSKARTLGVSPTELPEYRALEERLDNAARLDRIYSSGGNIYESAKIVPGDYSDPRAASKALLDMGVPGIKYLDAGSRGAGEGSRNYVVFDDKLITILRKYGWVPGAAIPAAALAELQSARDQEGM